MRQKAYRRTFDLACRRLSEGPIEERLAAAGLSFSKKGEAYSVAVPFFNERIELAVPGFSFKGEGGANVTLAAKIVILHYILEASGEPVGTELVPYEDIPGCRSYLPVFERRVVKPLIAAFGYARDGLAAAGRTMGAREEEYGDASFTTLALPRVPITFILWEGDEDFPPSMKVLFDRSIHRYLPLEDIVVVSKMAATRILKEARRSYTE